MNILNLSKIMIIHLHGFKIIFKLVINNTEVL